MKYALMHKIFKISISLCFIAILLSCASDKESPSENNFSFSAVENEPSVTSRLAYTDPADGITFTTQWKGTENAQLFTYDSNTPQILTPVGVFTTNNTTATTKAVFSGTTTSKDGSKLIVIYPSLGATNDSFSFTISGTRNATENGNDPMAHLDANNYMYAYGTQTDGTTLTFNPIMAMIRVTCTIPSGKTPKNLTLTDGYNTIGSEATISFSAGYSIPTITKTKTGLSLNFTNITSTSFYAYFMCLPISLVQDNIYLKMTYTDNTTYTLNAGEFTMSLNQGYRYIISADFTGNTSSSTQKYSIPVIFHTIYGDATSNIQYPSASRLQTIINNVNTLYANNGINVSFYLATRDPNGKILSEPGIDRLNWGPNYSYESIINSIDPVKVATLWDLTRYINIYTFSFAETSTGGVSDLPIMPHAYPLDGLSTNDNLISLLKNIVWAVGINNTYINNDQDNYALQNVAAGSGVNISCILAHELGHYLGLLHAFCDADNLDDYCDDTPNYNRDTYLANLKKIPTSDYNTLKFNRTYNGTTYATHNIMDYYYCYSDQFTADQNYRIRYVLNHSLGVPGIKYNTLSSKVQTRSTDKIIPHIIVCKGMN